MSEIIKRSEQQVSKPIGLNEKCLPVTVRDKITSALSKMTEDKVSTTLASLLRSVETGYSVANTINRDLVYLARIPKNLEGGVRAGELGFMQKADTGEMLGAIVGPDHLNRGFVRIEEGYMPSPDLLHSLSNLAMQQQLAHMAEVIDDVRSRVIILQETYDKALYGELRGMHQQLIQMRDTQDPTTRKSLATGAITSINKTRGKIEQRLIDELAKLPEAPATMLRALLKTFLTKGFKADLCDGYDKIQELFSYYLTASQLLAYIYAFLDEPAAYDDVFVPSPELLDNPNIKKLSLAEVCVGSIEDAWYKQPQEYLGRIQHESQRLFCDTKEYIEIEVTGKQLLEALNYEEAKDELNTNT
ncbi:MAG: hypothetical protein J6K55_12640 [Clostridia bacterium]|nr:hypothetical protein [Clostridia bacterium]